MTIRHRCHQAKRASVIAIFATVSLAFSDVSNARAIDDIRLSRIGEVATAEIELGCAMSYLDHTPSQGGLELRIRLALGYDCRIALSGTLNALYRPPGSQMARLSDIEFDKVKPDLATLTLRFEQAVAIEVRQTANKHRLTVVIDTSGAMPSVRPTPLHSPPTREETPTRARTTINEGPSSRVGRPPLQVIDRFVIRLANIATLDDVDRAALDSFLSLVIYMNEIEVDGRNWTELRMGFFDTEDSARATLTKLQPSFPSAWIALATPDERAQAGGQLLLPSHAASARAEGTPQKPASSSADRVTRLTIERVESLMAEARTALLRGNFDQSIKIYTRLLEESDGQHRRVARENLGVARQKNGQLAHAKSEYVAYLRDFPAGPDTRRVQQRLAAMASAAERPAVEARVVRPAQRTSQWEYYGGASQFYLRGVNLSRDDERDYITQSALLSQADIVVSRRGERFDVLGRANLGYMYDFVEGGTGDQALVSYAYADVTDNTLDLSARLGRQTRHKGGVLGRFDGLHVSYAFRPDLSINVTTGFPVDSPRFLADPDHYFYGASIELDNFMNVLDLSVFTNLQTIDGISDRKAIGAEAQYHSSRLNIIGMLDYDASYDVINSGLVVGNWRVSDRLILNGRFQGGAGPFLTTRNAIIGQPVNTVEELFNTYTEGQIRRLARNRTAEVRSGSAGLSAALSPRLQLNADITYYKYGSTASSGGVAAFPATGPQYYYGGHLLGSSMFKSGDSVILGYRHNETRGADSDTIIIDVRYPIGNALRINPRLALTLRKSSPNAIDNVEQWIANPMLRVLFRWRRNYRVEFEVGGQWSNQELPPSLLSPLAPDGSIETSAYYLQLGYWVDF